MDHSATLKAVMIAIDTGSTEDAMLLLADYRKVSDPEIEKRSGIGLSRYDLARFLRMAVEGKLKP